MSRRRAITKLTTVLTLAAATAALASIDAWASSQRHPHVGRLPGYPAIRGVIPVLGSQAAVAKHDRLVEGAFASARVAGAVRRLFGLHAAVPNEFPEAPCVSEEEEITSLETQDVCYHGGPIVHDPKIHLIFWQGKPGASGEEEVRPFPVEYEATVTRYFEDVAHDSNHETNVFAVQPQYGEEIRRGSELLYAPGEYSLQSEVEAITATDPFPASKCTDAAVKGPCLLDSDLHAEIEKYTGVTPFMPGEELHDIYVVLTPEGVGGCFEEGVCAYQAYCAYHGDFGGDGKTPGGQWLYADLPYLANVPGCDSGVHPNEAFGPEEEDEGADAVIDTASHEINETISDPIGSQCAPGAIREDECELNAWTDAIGQEIGDKCLPPESTEAGIYGTPLGEVMPGKPWSAYNQLIDAHPYFTQREWSNEAGLFEGACVQRRIEARYTISADPQATVPMTLNGKSSGASGDPAIYWVWNFGDGEQIVTVSPTLSHTFDTAGTKEVALTAFDAYGNSEATVETFTVGAAPAPVSPPASPVSPPATIVIREPVTPGHLTAAQLATKLGLPVSGKRLTGAGPFALGRGECPPACAVTIRLYAKVTAVAHKHRTSKLVLIGSAHLTFAAKGSGPLSLSLNAKGRALLRKRKSLAGKLAVAVEGQEGGTWQIVRSLRLVR